MAFVILDLIEAHCYFCEKDRKEKEGKI